jgi:hypothetical protein
MNPPIFQHKEPEIREAIRLINKFFPESKGFVTAQMGISIWNFVQAMKLGDFQEDYSCEPFGVPPGPALGLDKKGGFQGDDDIIFARLLSHAGFSPSGRCVIIPDAIGRGWSTASLKPIICDQKMAGQRIAELDCLFNQSDDSLFIFESGEAMAVDHDHRFYWSTSIKRTFKNGTTSSKSR